jgi:hypothetical protein
MNTQYDRRINGDGACTSGVVHTREVTAVTAQKQHLKPLAVLDGNHRPVGYLLFDTLHNDVLPTI